MKTTNIKVHASALTHYYVEALDNSYGYCTIDLPEFGKWLSTKLSKAKNMKEMLSQDFLRSLDVLETDYLTMSAYDVCEPTYSSTVKWFLYNNSPVGVCNVQHNVFWLFNKKPRYSFELRFKTSVKYYKPNERHRHSDFVTARVDVY